MTKPLADCSVHIIGLGLMGGSLAMALRGKVRRLTAEDCTPSILEKAVAAGVIHAVDRASAADMSHSRCPSRPDYSHRSHPGPEARRAGDRPGQHQDAHLRTVGRAAP